LVDNQQFNTNNSKSPISHKTNTVNFIHGIKLTIDSIHWQGRAAEIAELENDGPNGKGGKTAGRG